MIELAVIKTSENPSVFTLSPSSIEIGGKDSNLIDYLHVNIPPEWQGKVIRATFNQSALYGGNIIPKILNADGIIELKSDVTLCSGDLVIDAVGVDGSVSPSTGCHYTVYSHPRFGGTEQDVTPSEYQQFVSEVKGYSDSAQANATAANASKSAATLSEQNAKNSETAAQTAQEAAENAKAAAQGSAEAAAQSETNSKSSEQHSAQSETNAKASETAAKTSETNSADSATASATSATAAETAASDVQAANIVNQQNWTDAQKLTARTNINAVSPSDLTVGDWITPTLIGGWVQYNSTNFPVGYYKDKNNIVHFRGKLSGGSYSTIAFTLPVGYRPKTYLDFSVPNSSTSICTASDITPSGGFYPSNYGVYNSFIDISGITFRAEA